MYNEKENVTFVPNDFLSDVSVLNKPIFKVLADVKKSWTKLSQNERSAAFKKREYFSLK
jgi:hypothetical protein